VAIRALADAGVELHRNRVLRVEPRHLMLDNGSTVPFDLCLWAGTAEPPAWLAASGLRQDAEGWFLAEPTLQAAGKAGIFLAGDIVAIQGARRPRNGVYSVRQGLPLAENLRASLEGRPLRPYRPQRTHLALLQAVPGAIAAWGGLALRGAWALRWKERIDREWVESFRRLPPRPMPSPTAEEEAMRCEGCGAKLPPAVLRGALARLGGLPGGSDDAATLPPMPAGAVQSLDMFRPPTDDPWLAGRIAAVHALGDLAAMGAEPRAALALVALPHAAASVLAEDLFQLLHGARSVLEPAGAALLGGHSAEAAEPMIGFSVTGEVAPGAALRGSGLHPGEVLVLTKPLGTGAVLAATMRGAGHGPWLAATLAAMQVDPMPASRILRTHGATAATDVTGFGLLGHLGEMLVASGCGAALDPGAVPALPGALETLSLGIRSTLHPGNEEAMALLDGAVGLEPARLALLLDPQTSGGLLAGLPEDKVAACLAALRRAGVAAVAIGRCVEGPSRIRLQPGLALPRSPWDEGFDRYRPADPGEPVPTAAG
jgi:selenide,water dikinase